MGNKQSNPKINFPFHTSPIKRALLVGFDYSGDNKLEGPVNDIKLAEETLISTYNFQPENIFSYSDGNFNDLLYSFIQSSINGDQNVIHYSGHADYLLGSDYLVSEDMRVLTSGSMKKMFKEAKGQYLVVIDSCDAGGMLNLKNQYNGDTNTISVIGQKNSNQDFSSETRIVNFSSSGRTQKSFESEHGINGKKYGDFSYWFYNELKNGKDMKWIDLYKEVYSQVEDQTPLIEVTNISLFYGLCGEFI
jgi:hypothetical protein